MNFDDLISSTSDCSEYFSDLFVLRVLMELSLGKLNLDVRIAVTSQLPVERFNRHTLSNKCDKFRELP